MDRTRPGVLLSPLAILITANERGYAGKTGEAIQWDPSRALQHHLGVTKGYIFVVFCYSFSLPTISPLILPKTPLVLFTNVCSASPV